MSKFAFHKFSNYVYHNLKALLIFDLLNFCTVFVLSYQTKYREFATDFIDSDSTDCALLSIDAA